MMEKAEGMCWNCGAVGAFSGRHRAPCGAVCSSGCLVDVPEGEERHLPENTLHVKPWDGPPETDGHYHGTCPNGCFKDCCSPPGNHCGDKCQQCFPVVAESLDRTQC